MKHLLEKFNLPRYVKGKSFAEMSKSIKKRFEGLEDDSDSIAELKETMGRLRDMQEHVKTELGLNKPYEDNDGATEGVNQNPANIGSQSTETLGMQYANGGLITDPVNGKKKKINKTTEGETRDLTPEEVQAQLELENQKDPFEEVAFTQGGIESLFGTRDKLAGEYTPLNYGKYKGGNMFTEEVNSEGQYTLSPSKTNIRNAGAHRDTIKYLQGINPEANILNKGSNYGYKVMADRSEGSLFNSINDNATETQEPKAMGGYKTSHMGSFNEPIHKFELGGYNSDDLFKKGAFNQDSGASGMDKAGSVMAGLDVVTDVGKDLFGDTGVDKSGLSGNIDTSGVGMKAAGATLKGASAGMQIAGPVGAAVLGTIAGAGSLFGSGRKKKDAIEADTNFSYIKSLENNDIYGGADNTRISAYGGYKEFRHGGDPNEHRDPVTGLQRDGITPYGVGTTEGAKISTSTIQYPRFDKNTNEERKEKEKYDPSELLRYAGAATDVYQLATMKKPEVESFGQDNTKFKLNLTDEQALQNIIREGTSNVRDAIVSSSGGSGASARASLLASQLQGTKALSEAQFRAEESNIAKKDFKQQFDASTGRFNISQLDKQNAVNAQNRADYESNRSKFISSIGDSLSEVGLESRRLKSPLRAGFYYDAKGRIINKKTGKEDKTYNA